MWVSKQPAWENVSSVFLVTVAALVLVTFVRRSTLILVLFMAALGAVVAQHYVTEPHRSRSCSSHFSTKGNCSNIAVRIAANLALSILAFLTRYLEKVASTQAEREASDDGDNLTSLESCQGEQEESMPHRPIHLAAEVPLLNQPQILDTSRSSTSTVSIQLPEHPLPETTLEDGSKGIFAEGFNLFKVKESEKADEWQLQTSVALAQLPKSLLLTSDIGKLSPSTEYRIEGQFRVMPVTIAGDGENSPQALATIACSTPKTSTSSTFEGDCECLCHHRLHPGNVLCACNERKCAGKDAQPILQTIESSNT